MAAFTAISGYLREHFSTGQGEASPECPGDSCPHRGCEECGARWLASTTAAEPSRDVHHCGACHETFASETAFDHHRVRGSCLDGLEERGFVRGTLRGAPVWRERGRQPLPWATPTRLPGTEAETVVLLGLPGIEAPSESAARVGGLVA
jgi:hypothetical protein